MATDIATKRLMEIKHLVVVMMENRSFDQMLGYLQRDGIPDLDGLTGTESNPDADGNPVESFEWGPGQTVLTPPPGQTGKIFDPCHSEQCVSEQLADDNQGFVKNFIATRRDANGNPVTLPPDDERLPMGHFAAEHLPTYDFLARNYTVCDAWHSSVPGDTWPNRLFAMTGHKGPKVTPNVLVRLADLLGRRGQFIKDAPIYDLAAFTQQLAEGQWRWYSHDPATLRAADGRYRRFGDLDRDNFAYFDRQEVGLIARLLETPLVDPESFLDDCATGRLRDVSWIDPNFVDLAVLHAISNDDHPPADIKAGQAFILEVYEALSATRDWDDTLLVIVYDEHGGFFDHVPPPALGFDDGSGYQTYGVRVPALLVGPRVPNQVCHQLFDHTSLINTILRRFAADPDQAIARMPPRVAQATHLGVALGDDPRRDIPEPVQTRPTIAAWREASRAIRRPSRETGISPAPDGAGHPIWLHDFQEEFVRFALEMRRQGLKCGHP